MREIYIAREGRKREHDSVVINTARVTGEEGREEGIELGTNKKTRETALDMKAKELDNKLIAKYLDISEVDIEKILADDLQ